MRSDPLVNVFFREECGPQFTLLAAWLVNGCASPHRLWMRDRLLSGNDSFRLLPAEFLVKLDGFLYNESQVFYGD